ncbi:AMP-binding protein [Tahibacter amnicola]|uniref:AMP-binding protein n=1 Tax=Tahibacter amnicola TaxID=2976241 RepID=A0ABY6BGS3_9GAMM|nr:AMP-binding protein [Tahibacter amnicola]UXI69228.1 AMP-binding protein [Tahibacter amnicola]
MSKPIWEPSSERIERANISRFMRFVREQTGNDDIRRYAPLHDFSVRHPDRFWQLVWEFCGIRASGTFHEVLVSATPLNEARWFPGIRLNFAQNLLRFKDDRTAIIHRDRSGASREYSYAELQQQVARVAAALRRHGLQAGDRVAGWLPDSPESLFAMLATTSIGAIWSLCRPGADIDATVGRLIDIAPRILITSAAALGESPATTLAAIRPLPALERIVVVGDCNVLANERAPSPVMSWEAFLQGEEKPLVFEPMPFDHPLYLVPATDALGRGMHLVHGAGGTLIQHLKELVLHADLKREDKIHFDTGGDPTTWHWLASALAVGATLVMVDGQPHRADPRSLWNLVDDLGITVLVTDAAWLQSCVDAGLRPGESHKLLSLKTVLSMGSTLAAPLCEYVYTAVKDRLMVSACSGGTDLLSSIALGCPVLPVFCGEHQCRGLGLKWDTFDSMGKSVRDGDGDVALLGPFPSMPLGFWNDIDGQRYAETFCHDTRAAGAVASARA